MSNPVALVLCATLGIIAISMQGCDTDCATPCDEYDEGAGPVSASTERVCYKGPDATGGESVCAAFGGRLACNKDDSGWSTEGRDYYGTECMQIAGPAKTDRRLIDPAAVKGSETENLFHATGPIHTTGVADLSMLGSLVGFILMGMVGMVLGIKALKGRQQASANEDLGCNIKDDGAQDMSIEVSVQERLVAEEGC
eukprot:gnl/MRDRNA2_/MRDRNA2_78502_c0_seq1.p1 gnl/MRDRNA2_/MRDRNA2_78502_c0~~gnl/MRDRNA2_/MRDRNA2_78502_c0_seq1.p1  ORF type:complete len:197 (+),score=31.57 gnl/MRDRNA2_/MRDRNA2_78502_c0_seq1:87-677(+)